MSIANRTSFDSWLRVATLCCAIVVTAGHAGHAQNKTKPPPFLTEEGGVERMRTKDGQDRLIAHQDVKTDPLSEVDEDQATALATDRLGALIANSPNYRISVRGISVIWSTRYRVNDEGYIRVVVACCDLNQHDRSEIVGTLNSRWRQALSIKNQGNSSSAQSAKQPQTITPPGADR